MEKKKTLRIASAICLMIAGLAVTIVNYFTVDTGSLYSAAIFLFFFASVVSGPEKTKQGEKKQMNIRYMAVSIAICSLVLAGGIAAFLIVTMA